MYVQIHHLITKQLHLSVIASNRTGCVKYVALHLQWQPFSQKCPDAPLWHQPRDVIGVTGQPVDEAYDAHGGREEQHLRVEAQPGKVDPDPFTVVLPVDAFGTTFRLGIQARNVSRLTDVL